MKKLIVAGVAALALAGAAAPAQADASAHRFPTPVGGTTCKWLNFAPATDWGAGDIVAKHVSCKRARALITRWAKYGKPIAWSKQVRRHDAGLAHGDVRLRRNGAVIVFAAY